MIWESIPQEMHRVSLTLGCVRPTWLFWLRNTLKLRFVLVACSFSYQSGYLKRHSSLSFSAGLAGGALRHHLCAPGSWACVPESLESPVWGHNATVGSI